MLRRLLQPLWVLLAIIFLIEAWLWDHLEPIVAAVVALIPLHYQVNTWAARKGLSYKARSDEFTLATDVTEQ